MTPDSSITAVSYSTGTTRIILQYPDITLKGKNQKDFQNTLCRNIKYGLEHGEIGWNVGASHGRATIIVPEGQKNKAHKAAEIICKIPGVYSLAIACWLHPDKYRLEGGGIRWDILSNEIINLARLYYSENTSFAIQVNRTDKKLGVSSREIAVRMGDEVRRHTGWNAVNLTRPGQIFYIDVHPDGIYLYGEKIKGVGGLPVNSGGRVLALLSGGIDSPVAAFLMAKRGCHVDFIHFSASHVNSEDIKGSVISRLAGLLSQFTQESRLYVLPYTFFDLAMSGKKTGYELVLFRRFMMRVAQKLASEIYAQALINGDSLGQVASQTLENIVSSSLAVTIPVFRPLIGFNKNEIIDIARIIGSYDISIEPYKDCCALIARQPKTRSRHSQLAEIETERLPDYDRIIAETMADMICFKYRFGQLVE